MSRTHLGTWSVDLKSLSNEKRAVIFNHLNEEDFVLEVDNPQDMRHEDFIDHLRKTISMRVREVYGDYVGHELTKSEEVGLGYFILQVRVYKLSNSEITAIEHRNNRKNPKPKKKLGRFVAELPEIDGFYWMLSLQEDKTLTVIKKYGDEVRIVGSESLFKADEFDDVLFSDSPLIEPEFSIEEASMFKKKSEIDHAEW